MANRELVGRVKVMQTLTPAARTASANGTGVDLQGFEAVAVAITPGTITDGTHTPVVQESDDNVTFTNVAAGSLQGSLSNIASNAVQEIGYIGNKRYIRVAVTVAGATTGGVYGAAVVCGRSRSMPV
ncbi:MAG: hypothetical protein AB1796_11640 [Bacillota bacterium]